MKFNPPFYSIPILFHVVHSDTIMWSFGARDTWSYRSEIEFHDVTSEFRVLVIGVIAEKSFFLKVAFNDLDAMSVPACEVEVINGL